MHAWPSDGVQNIPISTVKTRVGDFSFAASGRLPWRHELSPANTPDSRGCGYETASGRGDWNERDPNYFSFCGGDSVNYFDSDGRLANSYYNFQMNGGIAGYTLNGIGNTLNNYSTGNSYLGAYTGFLGTLYNEAGAVVSPSTYVNGLSSYGNNINTVYQSDGVWAAGSYATTSWNVGAVWSGAANINLATGEPVGNGTDRAEDIFSGIAGTAGVASGGLGLYNWATAPAATTPAATTAASPAASTGMDPNILSGHGGLVVGDSSPVTIVPEGTSVTFWTEHGNPISDALGNAVETGQNVTLNQFPGAAGAQTYLPGSVVPNYTLFPPSGLSIMGSPTTVSVPTSLSSLLRPGMGNVNWAACRVVVSH
jgi:hypothetical protein